MRGIEGRAQQADLIAQRAGAAFARFDQREAHVVG